MKTRIKPKEFTCTANMPYEYDHDETEVVIYFDANPPERQTYHNPGSPAEVIVNRVVLANEGEIDLSNSPKDLLRHFEDAAWQYLEQFDERDSQC